MQGLRHMVRGSTVPDPNRRPVPNPSTNHSPVINPFRAPLKLLAVYSVAIVNGAAVLYILVRILRGIRRLLDGI